MVFSPLYPHLHQGPSDGGKLVFKLYAIKDRIELPKGATKRELLDSMKGKVLGKATMEAIVA